ncbi:hypothetical protein [Dokdonella sp.]|uniref:hypothetical protein n=1 Tax=Dokdonella sp. TaxID=2291710 RepID=UPI001B1CD72B|nr:hypothetical protein [Dokdonella sp.]MBO9664789.1 hypothetical protein [Dokdonella sp.]
MRALLALALAATPMASNADAKKTLLFESAVYPWKIHYVTDRQRWVREDRYYTVEHGGRPLVLPKTLFGTVRDVDRFVAASGFASGETHVDSVLLVFEARRAKPDGFEQREFVAILARSGGARSSTVALYTLQGEPIGDVEAEPAP